MTVHVQWDASFSVGDEMLDRQHQKLLGLCNALADCIQSDPQDAHFQFHEVLHELTQYARQHFQAEENLLRQYGYEDLPQQLAEHGAYEEKMTDWAFAATMDALDMREAQRFLAVWWRNHILIADMQYKALMMSKRQ
jgi:hemerythrin-like metal-binding protein